MTIPVAERNFEFEVADSCATAKPHAHLCYYARGVVVMFKTRKLRMQITGTGWNSASASSLVSSKLIMQIVLDPLSRFKTTPTKRPAREGLAR